MDILLVDGYNMIGSWPELNELKVDNLELARDKLVDMMADFQAYTGYKVVIVFDAHLTDGMEQHARQHRVEIIYTAANETADEKIEKLVIQLKKAGTRIYVATSDYAEQKAIFGHGALRKSARELLEEIKHVQRDLKAKIEETTNGQKSTKIRLTADLKEVFEKWRRGKGV